jgi:hypothetical protein
MASVLGELGFYNILVTGNSWFSGQWNMSQGFDEEQLSGGAAVNIYGEGQRRLSDAELRGAIDDRWYLHVHVMEPHAPYVPPEDYLAEEGALAPLDWDLSIKDEHYAAGAAYPTANIEVCLLNGLHKGHMPTRIPSIKPTPYYGLDIVEAVNSPHPTKDDSLKDQGTLRVPATLYYPNP